MFGSLVRFRRSRLKSSAVYYPVYAFHLFGAWPGGAKYAVDWEAFRG